MIVKETKDAVHVQQQVGEPLVIPRDSIQQLAPSQVSIMPKGLEQEITNQSLADLVAFLRAQE